jgi:integrase
MSIHWDKRNGRWRFEYDRFVEGRRCRLRRLLPKGWSRAEADAYDLNETGRLHKIATGVAEADPLIDQAVALYLRDKTGLKSYASTVEHLGAIAWAYRGKPISTLPAVCDAVREHAAEHGPGLATVRNRLAVLRAAARWAWKKHGLTKHDPAARMQLPAVKNERHVYIGRADMLRACRACTNWQAQIAIRVAFYTGMRLGELWRVESIEGALLLADTKNGDRRAIPVHPRISHLARHLPLTGPKITVQRAWERARAAAGLEHVHFHDLRHSAASELVNAGVDLYTVGQVLGHRDPKSTQRYAHLRHETLADAIAKIGRKRRA